MINTLFLLFETYTDGFATLILDFLSLASILCAIAVIISKNPIVSVLFLIGLFLSIALYLLSIGIGFIGLAYLLVYVGAVSILFLFILMLINVRVSELFSDSKNSIPLVILIAISFNNILSPLLPHNNYIFSSYANYFYLNLKSFNSELFFTTSNSWDINLVEINHITSIGNIMYTSYSIWLILTSLILLLAMVGAIVITIKQKSLQSFAKPLLITIGSLYIYIQGLEINPDITFVIDNPFKNIDLNNIFHSLSRGLHDIPSSIEHIIPKTLAPLANIDVSSIYANSILSKSTLLGPEAMAYINKTSAAYGNIIPHCVYSSCLLVWFLRPILSKWINKFFNSVPNFHDLSSNLKNTFYDKYETILKSLGLDKISEVLRRGLQERTRVNMAYEVPVAPMPITRDQINREIAGAFMNLDNQGLVALFMTQFVLISNRALEIERNLPANGHILNSDAVLAVINDFRNLLSRHSMYSPFFDHASQWLAENITDDASQNFENMVDLFAIINTHFRESVNPDDIHSL